MIKQLKSTLNYLLRLIKKHRILPPITSIALITDNPPLITFNLKMRQRPLDHKPLLLRPRHLHALEVPLFLLLYLDSLNELVLFLPVQPLVHPRVQPGEAGCGPVVHSQQLVKDVLGQVVVNRSVAQVEGEQGLGFFGFFYHFGYLERGLEDAREVEVLEVRVVANEEGEIFDARGTADWVKGDV